MVSKNEAGHGAQALNEHILCAWRWRGRGPRREADIAAVLLCRWAAGER